MDQETNEELSPEQEEAAPDTIEAFADELDGEEGEPPAEEPKEPEGPAEEAEPEGEGEEPEEKEPGEEKPEEGQPEPESEPEPSQEPEEEAEPEAGSEDTAKFFEEAQRQLAEQVYDLSEEEKEALATEPEKVLPAIAAKIHTTVLQSTLTAIAQQFPQIMEVYNQQRTAEQAAEQAFYEKWPVLQDSKYEADIVRLARAYRAANPDASQEDLIRDVGAQVVVLHRLELPKEEEQPPRKAYQPATSAPSASSSPDNPFEAFAEELLAEDE